MSTLNAASKGLDAMLKHLGIDATVAAEETSEELILNISTEQESTVMGRNGEKLDELQATLNKMIQKHFPNAKRAKVDCNDYRKNKEAKLVQEIEEACQKVLETGEDYTTAPLNSYFRRLAHNTVLEVEGVSSASPKSKDRLKQVTISKS